MSDAPTIISVTFQPDAMSKMLEDLALPGVKPGGSRDVVAVMSDGNTVTAFNFYTDELSFTESELIGLTEQQARDLYRERDIAYLRS